MKSPIELAERFRSEGMKLTPQRELIFRLVFDNASHPSADAVFAAARTHMPMISLKTVYQVLNDLTALGEIQSLDIGTGAVRFDPNTSDHHHAVCSGCGLILDVALADIPQLHDERGFVVHDVDVTFRGLCAACVTSASPLS